MSVGVAIINWNGKQLTLDFLESIYQHTERDDVEIIVFDNNSDDGSVPAIRSEFPEVTIMEHESNIGFVGGENEVVLNTDHEYYFLANNDCVVHTDGWLNQLIKTIESDPAVGIVGPDNEPQEAVFHGGAYWNGETVDYEAEPLHPKEVDLVSGAQFLVSNDVFERIGLIDETFWPAFNEELDFCYRAQRAGFKTVFEPRVLVEHLEGRTVDEDIEKYEIGRRYDIRFRWLNFPLFKLVLDFPNSLRKVGDAVLSRKGGLHVRDQWWERLKANIAAYRWNIYNIPDVIQGRRVRKRILREEDPHTEYWLKKRQTAE